MADIAKTTVAELYAGRSAAGLTGDELQTLAGEAFAQAAVVAQAVAHRAPGVSGHALRHGLEEENYVAELVALAGQKSAVPKPHRHTDSPGLHEAAPEFQHDDPKTS